MSTHFPTKFSSPSNSPGFLLWQVTNLWQRRIREALKEVNLTHVQFVLLASLVRLAEEKLVISQTDLSRFAKTDIMMTSQVLRALQKKGLITRSPHPEDSRAKCLSATAEGIEVVNMALQLVEQEDDAFFATLEGDLASFVASLRSLVHKSNMNLI